MPCGTIASRSFSTNLIANANQLFWKILRILNWNYSAVPTLQDSDTGTAIDTSVDKAI